MHKTDEIESIRNTKSITNLITLLLLFTYLISLVWILLFKLNVHFTYMRHWSHFNLIPYHDPMRVHGKVAVSELILNILVFIPFGLYIGALFPRWKWWKKMGIFFIVSSIIELLQHFLSIGAFDVTDIINNTAGGALGLLLYAGLLEIVKKPQKAQKIINILAGVGTFVVIGGLLFLKLNKLLMFRH